MNEELRQELLRLDREDLQSVVAFNGRFSTDEPFRAECLRLALRPDGTYLPWSLLPWEKVPVPPEIQTLLDTNRACTERLEEIIMEHGWPGRGRVGEDGADAAWRLLQHADRDNEFRRRCIPLLEEAVQQGEADPRHLATITDRVLAIESSTQVYGTSIIAEGRSATLQYRLLEPDKVDERRRAIGLPKLEDDLRMKAAGLSLMPYGSYRQHPYLRWPPRPSESPAEA